MVHVTACRIAGTQREMLSAIRVRVAIRRVLQLEVLGIVRRAGRAQ
jgi:hypothetical protein